MDYISAVPKDIRGIIFNFSTHGGSLVPLINNPQLDTNDKLSVFSLRSVVDQFCSFELSDEINNDLLETKFVSNYECGTTGYCLDSDFGYLTFQMKCLNCPKYYYLTFQESTEGGVFFEIYCSDCERTYRLCPKCTTQKTGQLLQLKCHVFKLFDYDHREDYSPTSMLRETDEYIFTRGYENAYDNGTDGPQDPIYVCKNEFGTITYKKDIYFCDENRFIAKINLTGPDGGYINRWKCEYCKTEYVINDL